MVASMGRKSRRKTPWDNMSELTPTQIFLKEQYKMSYADRHRKVSESGESELINSYSPVRCPFCKSEDFDSWNNKNAFTTSRYWLQKLFLTLEGVQDNIVLSGTVWLDETYYTVRSEDIVYNEDGSKLRGISRNQIRIVVATDKTNTVFLVEGKGKLSQRKTWETFGNRIAPKSTLMHDKESAHKNLLRRLSRSRNHRLI